MTGFISTLRTAAQKRAAYNRTVAELENLPLDIALDLNIDRHDARRLARMAVYGA
ncbi:hypothetical protein ACRDNQ_03350 [Palleronia sp. KMU-117]|uniref:hypothetical protein n=1 Tax=Palleronia sp. KMU-117 TaxID=3434108 RepID=UPI003D751F27